MHASVLRAALLAAFATSPLAHAASAQGAPPNGTQPALPAYAPARDSAQTFAGWPRALSRTTPTGNDTVSYWQQRADYRIIARLDERRERLVASGTLTYVNRSPDTLRELFVHQHLNAFRPGSRWAADDAREGRVRFQTLAEPSYAFERFTADPTVDGTPVRAEYPGGTDSTVVRLALPRPLGPGDSVTVRFAWEARPSTIPRRQGRRGRSYDFAQWYPKVAVYDRGGWQPHALVPSGEFYGEFGDFDVTMILADDQVVGATGVPVDGDPGWGRVARGGRAPRPATGAYANVAAGPRFKLVAGERSVRFVARGVHHFGWSTSPDYRYEGGTYVRAVPAPNGRFQTWDTVSVHALYRPGDDSSWGGGRAVARTINTIRWLEQVYGPYGYPQMTVLHRIEGGGTEFPMMQMNGSAQQSLLLHEGGHIFSYGLLANNEWQRGWMDEGLTSYQTSWATGTARHALAYLPADSTPAVGARLAAASVGRLRDFADSTTAQQNAYARTGRAQPLGLRADQYLNFTVYNTMVYARGEQMYAALRDVLGEAPFASFLRDYYARWAFRHVDDAAMRASAERAAGGRDLGWFFGEWIGGVGTIDYALRDVSWARAGACWATRGTLVRTGSYRHPMPLGIRTAAGWTVVRGDPALDRETIVRYTPAEPTVVRLDPLRTTEALTARFYQFTRAGRSASSVWASPAEAAQTAPSFASARECEAAQRGAGR